MKKIILVILLICSFNMSVHAKDKTLGEYKKELEKQEQQLKDNNIKHELTESELKETNSKISSVEFEIKAVNESIDKLALEIIELNEKIDLKDEEIKSVLNFVQIAQGESSYLEYIMGSKSFTDFIYRITVSEQMINYNDKLMDEYDDLVEKTKKREKEMETKQKELGDKKSELNLLKMRLNKEIDELDEGELDLESQIKASKKAISTFVGCYDSETASQCYIRKNPPKPTPPSSGIVTSGSIIRPISYGMVTSEYGWRYHPTMHYSTLHTGIDVSAGGTVPIYAAASGKVGAVIHRASCGGNQVYIYHNIGGKTYTTGYMHLRTINVSVGQTVSVNSVIGTMGGNPATEYWDSCSTGQHLHFMIAHGLYFSDYSSYATFKSKTFNPRNMVNFPSRWVYFNGR